jgi:hypothetical protein
VTALIVIGAIVVLIGALAVARKALSFNSRIN